MVASLKRNIMKDLIFILKKSKLISIFLMSSIFVLLNIACWVMDLIALTTFNLLFAPVLGGFVGYLIWKQLNQK